MDALTVSKPRGGTTGRTATVPYLYLALEAGRAVGGSARFGIGDVDAIEIGRGAALAAHRAIDRGVRSLRIDVPDAWMSGVHVRIARRGGECALADAGSRNGTLLNGAPVGDGATLRDGDVVEVGGSFFLYAAAQPETEVLDRVHPDGTVDPELEQRLVAVDRIAASDVSVVLHGPSGSGKEVLARAIHAGSRRPGPFVAVNCGALPATLVESELFGHRRGAFSGAIADRTGLIAAADGGTLFLDEIGDLPLAAQPALLRALQERMVTPVGGTAAVPVDFRLVSATHRDLEAQVAAGGLREDLWARLGGFVLELPALAERRADLSTLIAVLGERLAPGRGITLTADAARALLAYPWPRNVRELEKVLGAALALAGGGELDLAHLPGLAATSPPPAATTGAADPRRDELVDALRAHRGNVSAAARALGKPRSQVQRWMRRWDLRAEDFARPA